jgi:hypothetical protein
MQNTQLKVCKDFLTIVSYLFSLISPVVLWYIIGCLRHKDGSHVAACFLECLSILSNIAKKYFLTYIFFQEYQKKKKRVYD